MRSFLYGSSYSRLQSCKKQLVKVIFPFQHRRILAAPVCASPHGCISLFPCRDQIHIINLISKFCKMPQMAVMLSSLPEALLSASDHVKLSVSVHPTFPQFPFCFLLFSHLLLISKADIHSYKHMQSVAKLTFISRS